MDRTNTPAPDATALIEQLASRYAADLVLAEMAAIRRLAATHGLTLDPRVIDAEARDRVALALYPRTPAA